MSQMNLLLIRTLWGILDNTQTQDPIHWERIFEKLKSEGYSGVETSVGPFFPFAGKEDILKSLLKKYDMSLVSQVHTCGYPVSSRKVEDHVASFRKYVREAKQLGAIFVNSHSGSDSWTMEENIKFFESCLQIEKEEGIKVVHETHRRRVLYNPWTTREVLKRLPYLKVNADLSHWVVVSERCFDEKYDDDWPEIINLVAKHCHFIHARVGYAEGPQISDPRAPEFASDVEYHEKWWEIIWKAQEVRGEKVTYIEPEFGECFSLIDDFVN